MSTTTPIRRALISVFDKSGLAELASALNQAGIEIVSTGSTAKTIESTGVPVVPVENVTGFPECLDGRVKTLHPRVHAGILADRRRTEHTQQLTELDVAPFDLVVVNLYPFTQTVASGAEADECVEQIDIGGPTLVRAAAKNHQSVAVVVSPESYDHVHQAIADGGFDLAARQRLAATAFAHTAAYDVAVARWFNDDYVPSDDGWPEFTGTAMFKADVLRYGENPHQQAALYRPQDVAIDSSASQAIGGPDAETGGPGYGLARARQLHGKEMSYNNYTDTDAAWRAALDFSEPAVAVVKHANPCGIATAPTIEEAHSKAHACDPVSAFGGVIAANHTVNAQLAQQVSDVFTEVIIAPGFDEEAIALLTAKKNIRILQCLIADQRSSIQTTQISGGALMQSVDRIDADGDSPSAWTLAAGEPADDELLAELEFAWRAVRSVKSNAILLARDGASVGVGMGQVNRVDACRLAVERAGAERARGSVAASDAFFPFADGPGVLIDAGVRAIIQPGGSVRDNETIEAAAAAGVTMYLTGARHFYH